MREYSLAATLILVTLGLLGCGSDDDKSSSGSGGSGASSSGGSSSGGTSSGGTGNGGTGNGGTGDGGTGNGGSGGGTGGSGTGGSSGSGNGGIGEWTDAPGECPSGATKVEIATADELASASRGEGAHAGDAPDTCYFIKNGDYTQSGVLFYVTQGGVAGGARRVFVGESRTGVVIHGRGSVDDGVGDVTISNLTFDITGYSAGGSFNTLGLGTGKNLTVDHVTFTGDCATGLKGGHIEVTGSENVLVDSCLIEKFGHCASGGHEDHGVYLAAGKNITIQNSVIRENASRGIQLYTQGGEYGTLDGVNINHNRITANGHGDYEDGIVINGSDSGTIENVSIMRNLFYKNHYSGIRFAGGAESNVDVSFNTFDSNGAGSSAAGRSEINIDDEGGGAGASIANNIFNVGNTLINDCYDGSSLGFSIGANFVNGSIPTGAKGNCVASGQTTGDPGFVDAANGDYHTTNSAAAAFGAYAP